ncbi:MAG: hypothetical protein JXR65_10470 [Bacteroidales bacterium]|nr:hypothetical protein [Bacteroidales bacterium]
MIDPACEEFFGWVPYNYALNNPIFFIDKDGKRPGGADEVQDKKRRLKLYYSGAPISISGSLQGKLFGGELGYKKGNTELKLKGYVGVVSATATGESIKGEGQLLVGEAVFKGGKIEVVEKVNAAKGSVELIANGLENPEYSVGNIEAGLKTSGKEVSVNNSLYTSNGKTPNEYSLGKGDNTLSSDGESTKLTVGAGPGKVNVEINHNKMLHFVTDLVNIVGNALIGNQKEKINNKVYEVNNKK